MPDLVLLLPGGDAIDREEYFEGGPDVVVEIRSPRDETYEKLPFYAALGAREVWVIDRDTKAVEVHALCDGAYRLVPAEDEGWIASTASGLSLRALDGAALLRWTDAP